MKNNFNQIFAAFAAFAVAFSCSKVEGPQVETNQDAEKPLLGETITISATLSDAMTKVSFGPSYDDAGKPLSLSLAWEERDVLRVYNHADRTKYTDFKLVGVSVDQKTGVFSGTPVEADSYDVEVLNEDKFNYAAQTQPSDGVTSSLKYFSSASGVIDLSNVEFKDYSSVLAITAKMPEGVAGSIKSMDLIASEPIFNGGENLTISFDTVGDSGDDGILHFYATLPQGSQKIAEGTSIIARFNAPDTDHTVYTRYIELGAKELTAGRLNTINVNAAASDKHAGLTSCDGTSTEKAYLIGDKYQLQAMNSLMKADATTYFRMVDDVDLTQTSWVSVSGKVSFDGANHTIKDVKATSGLFAEFEGEIKDLVVDGIEIAAEKDNTGVLVDYATNITAENITVANATLKNEKAYTGVLVGKMEGGTLTNCTTSGSLETPLYYSGGLVGYATTAEVDNCSSSVAIVNNRTNYSRTGGLIGEIHGGSITNSYATGNTDAKGAYCGGLVGMIDGEVNISKCYATGAVTQLNKANYNGALVGFITSSSNVSITNCYASGKVTGNNYCGGFAGGIEGKATIINCYTCSVINAAKWSGCVFAGNVTNPGKLELSGFIGWNVSNRVAFWYNQSVAIDGNYMGTEGTISAKAREFGWDETIWDLTADDPTLK